MRKTAAVITVLLLLLAAQAAFAVDLEAGWYVKLGLVVLYGWDGTQERAIDWNFVAGLGPSGPFEVSAPDPLWPQRMVSIPQTVTGVLPGTSVYLLGNPEVPVTFPSTTLSVQWESNCDISAMLFEVLLEHPDGAREVLWTQGWSEPGTWITDVLYGTGRTIPVGDSVLFRVTAVPEPSCFTILAAACCGCVLRLRGTPRR